MEIEERRDGELPELTAVAVIQKSLIQNILITLFENASVTAKEVRLIVRSAGIALASEVADREAEAESDGLEADIGRIVEAGESYLVELEESILGQRDPSIEVDDDDEGPNTDE